MNSNPMMDFFRKLRLPLNRGKVNLHTFLYSHFREFDDGLEMLLSRQSEDKIFDKQIYRELEKNREFVRSSYRAILETLKAYSNGATLEAYRIFEDTMNDMQDYLLFSEIRGRSIRNQFCRIRSDKGNERKDLFHIPFNETTKVKAYRYSIAGFPCLYLAGSPNIGTALSLCWFECGMPNQFYWSEFKTEKSVAPLYLIDFTATPFFGAMNPRRLFTSALNNLPTNDFAVKMIMTYPLMAACSLIVEEKGQNFIPEYIIPQMLLLWARNNKKCRGIAYFSSSEFGKARDHNAFNIAIPPRQVMKNGYCGQLKKEFKLSQPRFVGISNDIFKPIGKKFICNRDHIHENLQKLDFEPIREMVSICNDFLFLHSKVRSGKAQDIPLIYDYINNLNLFAETILKFKNQYFIFAKDQIQKEHTQQGTEHLISLYSNTWEAFISFRELIRSFWDFIDKQVKIPKKSIFKFIG
jgi:hypothetical protein